MRRSVMSMRRVLFFGLIACTCWPAGCGPSKAPTGSVSGKVTLQGKPLADAVVTLVNPTLGAGGSATLDASGNYRISGELPTGQYEVMIQPPPAPPPLPLSPGGAPQTTASTKVDIPSKYRDSKTSGLIATIKAGPNTADFSLD